MQLNRLAAALTCVCTLVELVVGTVNTRTNYWMCEFLRALQNGASSFTPGELSKFPKQGINLHSLDWWEVN